MLWGAVRQLQAGTLWADPSAPPAPGRSRARPGATAWPEFSRRVPRVSAVKTCWN